MEDPRVWGCERADARSHPQTREFITEIPNEPRWICHGKGPEAVIIHLRLLLCLSQEYPKKVRWGHTPFFRYFHVRRSQQ
jgi:hypothetical protein